MHDERAGCPSASAFGQYVECEGAFALSKVAPEEPPSSAAQRGTRVHSGCAGEIPIETLAPDEQETVIQLIEQEEILLNTFISDGYSIEEKVVEQRLWEQATESRWSGKADVVYLMKGNGKKIALIVDYKSTRYAGAAENNLQLAALAVLVDSKYQRKLDEAHVALVYPDGYDAAYYDSDGLELAAEECNDLVNRITITHTQHRAPSENACKWCKAKTICPEARGQLQVLAKTPKTAISPADLPRLLDICAVADGIIKDVRAQAKTLLEAGGELDGWELRAGAKRSKITNTEEVYRRAAILGIDGEMFSKRVTISKKDLETLVREELGQKGKQVKETVANLIEECTEETITSPQLKAKK